jgi:hypothetical protein
MVETQYCTVVGLLDSEILVGKKTIFWDGVTARFHGRKWLDDDEEDGWIYRDMFDRVLIWAFKINNCHMVAIC